MQARRRIRRSAAVGSGRSTAGSAPKRSAAVGSGHTTAGSATGRSVTIGPRCRCVGEEGAARPCDEGGGEGGEARALARCVGEEGVRES